MKLTFKKTMATLMAFVMLMAMSATAFAAEPAEATSDIGIEAQYGNSGDDSGIQPYAFYGPDSFTFWESNRGNTRWYDGGHMAVEITANSTTPGLTMQVVAHIDGKGTVSWDVPVDGQMHKKDWISFGTSSGRNVYLTYSCDQNTSAHINVSVTSYSW